MQCQNRERFTTWEDRIAIDPQLPVGKPVIKGTRIAVEFVADLLARGWTVEQVLHECDHLAMEDIQACLAYASDTLISERVYPAPSRLRNQMRVIANENVSGSVTAYTAIMDTATGETGKR